ncbi:MAG: hypothetical protein CBD74_11970 [Saprospirales bacterium TMED214]|nr:MAG: hypothetical protein CBD74_11970 [Saprospirales bacterium TMED214]
MDSNQTLLKPSPITAGPFAKYKSGEGRYDEYLTRDGKPRAAWRPIANYLDQLGQQGIDACAMEATQLVHESGANFRVTRDTKVRPWQLDIVPFVLDAKSWKLLEAGLQQRVRVLEAVLADMLGPQRLFKERILPAELLNANPQYVRAYNELPIRGHRLILTATDLARDDDGSWWVTGDRTRAPSGLGFALENRVITSRVLPHLIRSSNVTRLASFFSSLQEHLISLAPRSQDNPRVAILTPGESSYRYVEDAYLARYLGYTLVQGRDLAIRGNQVYLKTLGGLLPIEVILRHISDAKCDPLELDPLSTQGATGMLGAIRSGNVAMVNRIGGTLVQMPALLPFLGSACRFLFDEDLLLPSLATYWCGGTEEREFVLANLEKLVIREAFAVSGDPPIDPIAMTAVQRDELVARIMAKPHQYVGQDRPSRSRTPVWNQRGLESWHVGLRSFQFQNDNGIEVLPGGLVRVSPDPKSLDHSPSSGRLGQDCWVIGEEPIDQEKTLLPPSGTSIQIARSGAELPSRVAENFFWLGRYAERCESIARLLRTTMVRIAGETALEELPDLSRLIAALAAMGQIEPDYAVEEFGKSMPRLEVVLPASIFDRTQNQGLQAAVTQIVEKAIAVRDRISIDAYRIISRIGDQLAESSSQSQHDMVAMIDCINQLISDLMAFSGLTTESTTRTHGWRFLQLGRRIERAYQTAELLDSTLTYAVTNQGPLLEAVLQATDSLMTYRSRYLLQLQPAAVIDLLMTDDTNPRSVAFQMKAINELIDHLPTDPSDFSLGHDQRIAESLQHLVRMSQPSNLAVVDASGRRADLKQLLHQLMRDLPNLSNAITARYLIHTSSTQKLTGRVDVARITATKAQTATPTPSEGHVKPS